MTGNTKPAPRPAAREGLRAGLGQALPRGREERLQRIEAVGRRISEYIEFMRKVDDLGGTSAKTKARAVAAFYERLVVLECQLARIQEELRLG